MKKQPLITAEPSAIERYEMLKPMLDGLYKDMSYLASKKQDGILGKPRIAMINRLLTDIKGFLKDEATHGYLDLLEEDSVPKNADALLVLGQYRSALNQYFTRYSETENEYSDERVWRTK